MMPIMREAAGFMNAGAALLATNPPTQPFAVMEASGLPKRMRSDDERHQAR